MALLRQAAYAIAVSLAATKARPSARVPPPVAAAPAQQPLAATQPAAPLPAAASAPAAAAVVAAATVTAPAARIPRLRDPDGDQTPDLADYINEGATGASGHVDEPYLAYSPRPDILLPAYLGGRNLAESYWMSIPALSWQNIVIGDPLCSLGKPAPAR